MTITSEEIGAPFARTLCLLDIEKHEEGIVRRLAQIIRGGAKPHLGAEPHHYRFTPSDFAGWSYENEPDLGAYVALLVRRVIEREQRRWHNRAGDAHLLCDAHLIRYHLDPDRAEWSEGPAAAEVQA